MKKDSARRWLVSGTVQGVGFRFFVQHKATKLGLNGWTRNLDDGTVEVYACGTPEKLDDLGAALHIGPAMAEVRNVEEENLAPKTESGFRIR